MKIVAVTGASGLIGSALCAELEARGYRAVPLKRVSSDDAEGWNTGTGRIRLPGNERADVVVHLAGEPVAGLWTAAKKRAIRHSRVDATWKLAKFLANLATPPETFVSASAIGIYGNRGDELLTENSTSGPGFLAGVVTNWEDAAIPAAKAGIRVAHPRFGIVLSKNGGALKPSIPIFKLGLGASFGNGRQWQSWISLEDTVRALLHILEHNLEGPVNIVAPHAVTNAQFTRHLAAQLRRPVFLNIPAFVLRAALKDAADEMLLSSAHVLPHVLGKTGFTWQHPTLPEAFAHELD